MGIATRHIAPAKAVTDNRLTVIIASANAGYRMRSRGAKALLPMYQNMTLLEIQLRTIWQVYPNAEVLVTIGFQASKIRNMFRGTFPVRFIYNPLYESKNTMYAIALALEAALPSNVIVINGDTFFNLPAIQQLQSKGTSKAVVQIEPSKDQNQYVGAVVQDNIITNLSYGLPQRWCEIAYLTGKELKLFEKIAFNHEVSAGWFFHEGLNTVINSGGILLAHQSPSIKFISIESTEDISQLGTINENISPRDKE